MTVLAHFGINTSKLRLAHFFAQAAQETEQTRTSFANLPPVFQLQTELSPCTIASTLL